MSSCARCSGSQSSLTGALAFCPEHALAVLENVRRHLATTLTSLERATDRATYVVASGRSG
jgi:hypothetical protein